MREKLSILILSMLFNASFVSAQDADSLSDVFIYHGGIGYIVVLENGKPNFQLSGAATWITKGSFLATKHAYGLTEDSQKELLIFFNGTEGRGCVDKLWQDKDLAIIRFCEDIKFDMSLEPIRLSRIMPMLGDKVFIRGVHTHLTKDTFPVLAAKFEEFEGWITQESIVAKLEFPDRIQFVSDNFMEIVISGNHEISFRGLSGSAVFNSDKELMGIIAGERFTRYEYNPDDSNLLASSDSAHTVMVTDTLYALPLASIEGLAEIMEAR